MMQAGTRIQIKDQLQDNRAFSIQGSWYTNLSKTLMLHLYGPPVMFHICWADEFKAYREHLEKRSNGSACLKHKMCEQMLL